MGLFVTFEGGEGCGKSYQSKLLQRKLSECGINSILTFEPGGTILGNKIRHLLKHCRGEIMSPEAELLLIMASRSLLISEVISPCLLTHRIVICDRFTDSTLAYQGYGRGIKLETISMLNSVVTRNIDPDLTILLDIPVEDGLKRKRTRNNDRFEKAGLPFHNKVRQGYLEMAYREPSRWIIIDAMLPRFRISNIIWDKVCQLLAL